MRGLNLSLIHIWSPGNNSQSFGPLIGNPSQFVAPRGLTFGDAGRNYLNNPGRSNFDVALLKHFKIKESAQLEFRAEAFNLFNHTQFRVYDPEMCIRDRARESVRLYSQRSVQLTQLLRHCLYGSAGTGRSGGTVGGQ